ncbi:TetR/AcrR family transcriptional regulator [Pseudonocardia hydrocarbonoxydans]|uniref:TetR family transcriptional regulator n=1 Tax=Pseudonocardia hydrocarbonoxydans TaxID=76726 RepID=A0A4Y3WP21_9PSEU|nr:TetR/AcrR family transcriptional regulator [Pseudonocardia hydrocarbonoxydans]GEC20555.1 TetR family transcriptional regulator [Pseudonocardia hydrocarbonoxydans]
MAAPDRRPPRTQGQRTADSRSLILDAAIDGLVTDGYHRTSTVAIQTRAGVSRGRLLHHFPSREELLIAAAQHLVQERVAEMDDWIARSPHGRASGAERIDLATDLLWETFRQPYFWAAMELWTAARTDPDLRTALLEAERRLLRTIEKAVDTMYGPVLSGHPEFADVRDLVFTSMRGVALTYALHDRDPLTEPHLARWKRLLTRTLL